MKVQLDRELVDAAPGGQVTVNVTVVNDGSTVVTPVLHVSGVDAEAVTGATQLPPLTPGVSWTTELSVTLPAEAPAGSRRLAVVATDRQRPAAGAAAHLTVRTGSAAAVSLHVSPREVRGRMGSRFKVNVHNQGTSTVELGLRGEGDGLRIRIRPSTITLPPGTHVRVRARARTGRPALFRTRRRPFLVTAQGTTTPVSESGAFEQSTVLGGSLVRTLGIVLVVALWAGGAFAMVRRLNGSGTDAASAPTTTTIAAPSDAADGAGDGGENAGGDAAGGDAATPTTAASGEELPSAAGGAGGAGGSGAPGGAASGGSTTETVGASGVVVGTIAGPSPLGGITVSIEPVSAGDEGTAQTGKLLNTAGTRLDQSVAAQTTTTDDNGRFRFSSGLAMPALYRLTASKPGYDVTSVVVELTATKATVELALTMKAATGALSGLVTDAGGTPLTDAAVTVTGRSVTYATTVGSVGAAAGTWQLDGVATPGTYLVSVTSDGYASASTVVTLGGGERRDGITLAMVAGVGTIRGKVTSKGVAVGGLSVAVQSVGGDLSRATTTLTQPDLLGTFELPALPLGRYTLTVSGEGWLTSTSQVVLDSGELVVNLSDLQSSTATVQGTVLLESLTAEPCRYPDNNYDPTTVSPQRCGNVGVTVTNSGGTWRTTTASLTGEFRLSGIPSGTYTVTFERFGYRTATLSAVLVAGTVTDVGPDGPTGKLPVVLHLSASGGQGIATVQGVLRNANEPTDTLDAECMLTRVTITEGATGLGTPKLDAIAMPDQCPQKTLHLPVPEPPDRILPCQGDTRLGLQACWLPEGGIRISGLTAGAKTFRFGGQGFDDTLRTVQVPAGGTTELGIVTLPPLGSLDGLVMGPGDTPLASARVMVVPSDPTAHIPPAPTDPTGGWYDCTYHEIISNEELTGICVDTGVGGEYNFGNALKSGSYRLIAPIAAVPQKVAIPSEVSLDHELRERTVTVESGGHTTQDISLRRYGAIYGSVQLPNSNGGFDFVDEPVIKVTRNSDQVVYCTTEITLAPDGLYVPRCRITRGDGQYRVDRLTSLAPGDSYTVTFSKEATVGGATVVYEGAPIELSAGVPFNNELLRNVIMRIPQWSVDGKVVWRPGGTSANLEGATVTIRGVTSYRVLPVPPFREPILTEYTRTTLADGTFAKPTLDDGKEPFVGRDVTLTVTKPGFQTKTLTVLYDGHVTKTTTVELEPTLQPLDGTLKLTPGFDADLDLKDETEATVFARLSVAAVSTTTGQRTVTAVNSSGAFRFSDLRPGGYTITVSGAGVETAETTIQLSPTPSATPAVDQLEVKRLGRLRVSVKQADGQFATGATVTLLHGTDVVQTAVTCVDPTTVGGVAGCAAGTVTFDDIAPQGNTTPWDFTVRVRKTGWQDQEITGVSLSSVRSQLVAVTGLVRYGWITGKVVGQVSPSEPTTPLAGATVTVAKNGTTVLTTVTAADGSYSAVGALVAGDYTVSASFDGYVAGSPVSVTVVDGAERAASQIVLTASLVTVSGTITDESYNRLGGVAVRLVDMAGYTTTAAAAGGATAGDYSLSVPPGLHTMEFSLAGRDTVTLVVTLAPGSARDLDIIMPGPTGTLFGIVFGADVSGATAPVPGADVEWSVVPPNGVTPTWTAATTDSAGVFTFTKVAANVNVQVRASKSAYDPPSSDTTAYQFVQLSNGASRTLTFTLVARTRPVSFTVKGRGAALLDGVSVTATSGATTVSATTNASGVASLALKPGTWTFATTNATSLTDPHYNATSPSFTVPRPETALPTPPALQLTPWEGLSVTVTGRANDLDASLSAVAVNNATVTFTVAGNAVTIPRVGSSNTYSLRYPWGAATGTLAVSASGYDASSTSVSTTSGTSGTTTVDLYQPAQNVTMHVVSGQGTNNLGNVDVVVSLGSFTDTKRTNAAGNATFSLRPGLNYTYTTSGAAAATISNAGTVPHTDATTATTFAAPTGATITLNPVAGTITGLVSSTFAGGSTVAVSGAAVTATLGSPTALSAAPTTTSNTGTYSLNVWRGTNWSVTSTLLHYTTATATTTVDAATPAPVVNLAMARDPGTISGKVQTDALAPVQNAVVTLRQHGSATVLATRTTVANGAYSFTGLDPFVTFDVTFDATGATLNSAVRQPLTTYSVTLANPGATTTLDHTQSATANSLTIDVHGALLGQNTIDYPIATAPTATLVNTATGVVDPITVTLTQDANTKRWGAVVPGLPTSSTYKLTVDVPGFLDSTGAAGPFVVSNITVGALTGTTTSVVVYPPARSVAVTLTDASGAALASASVKLQGGGLSPDKSDTTDANGTVTFTGVPLSVGGTPYTVVLLGDAANHLVGGSFPSFDLPAGTTALTQTYQIERFTVQVKTPADVNHQAAFTAAATVNAFLTATPATTYTFGADATTTGTYHLDGVFEGGAWSMHASRTGYVTSADQTLTVTADGTTTVATPVVLALTPLAVTVTMTSTHGAGTDMANGTVVATPTTGIVAAKSYSFTKHGDAVSMSLEPGEWTLAYSADGHVSTSVVRTFSTATTITQQLVHPETVVLTVTSTPVTSTTTYTNLAVTAVTMPTGGSLGTPVVSGNEVTMTLVPGDWTVEVSAADHYTKQVSFTVKSAQTAGDQPTVALVNHESLTVRVEDGTGTLIAGADVTAVYFGGSTTALTLTGSTGLVSGHGAIWADLPANKKLTLTASATGYDTATASVTYSDQGEQLTATVTLTLTAPTPPAPTPP